MAYETQINTVRRHLRRSPLTGLEALNLYGIMRLASRINEAERLAKIAEAKAKSNHIGDIGARIELEVSLKFHEGYPIPGYHRLVSHLYIFKNGENTVIYRTTSPLGIHGNVVAKIRGTIKEHGEYKGEKQTVLQRVKVLDVWEAEKNEENEKKCLTFP